MKDKPVLDAHPNSPRFDCARPQPPLKMAFPNPSIPPLSLALSLALMGPALSQGLDCTTLVPDAYEDNDDCANAVTVPNGAYLGDLNVERSDRDFYAFSVPAGGQLFVTTYFDSSVAHMDMHLRDANSPACGLGPIGSTLSPMLVTPQGKQVLWNNTDTVARDVILEVRISDWDSTKNCNTYDMIPLTIDGAPNFTATSYCGPAETNSAGLSTQITATATSVGSGLHLNAWDGPLGEFGYFLVGTAPADPGVVIADGRLCLDASTPGASLLRYNRAGSVYNSLGQFGFGGFYNWGGTSTTAFGFDVPGTLPDAASTPILAGQTLYFQLWHRDNTTGGSNFSNGVAVDFL